MAGPYAPGGPPGWSPPLQWGPPGGSPPNTREADIRGLTQVFTAALISVIGSALGVAVPLALSSVGYISISIPATGSSVGYGVSAVYTVLGIAIVGLAISILALWLYREGFLAIRPVDNRFSSSPTWALLAIVGLIMVCLGLVAVLVGLVQLLTCSGAATTVPVSCVPLGALLGGAALLVIGLIVLLIGYIGTLVAIWRLGDRYDTSLFKIGAVLLIIPFLSIVGQILVLVAAHGARTRVEAGPAYSMAPSIGYPPPPPMR
jgi:Protein of unknown function (DUF973)